MDYKLLNTKALKDYARDEGFRLGGDVPETLNKEIIDLVRKSFNRAQGNDRKTVMGKDY